jgi:hypothetical protein
VLLVATNADGKTGPQLQWFLNGSLTASPVIVDLSDFPKGATPIKMKLITVGGIQYAWIALLAGSKNIVALYDLATKSHLSQFDVDLGTLEPLAVTVGIGPGRVFHCRNLKDDMGNPAICMVDSDCNTPAPPRDPTDTCDPFDPDDMEDSTTAFLHVLVKRN